MSNPIARDAIEQRIADAMATWHGLYEAEKRPLRTYLYDALAELFAPPAGDLQAIGEHIRTQDNRCTDQPMFAVMEKREIVTLDTHDHDRIVWVETKSGDYREASPAYAKTLEAKHQRGEDYPDHWARYAMKEIDVFVTACFTEQGCKDFLARDGHNHRKPFIYAFGSYRNAEYQTVRRYLAALPAPDASMPS